MEKLIARCPSEIAVELKAFMKHYKPVNSESEARYYMTTEEIALLIRTGSGNNDFSIDDAYNFMIKAGYGMQASDSDKANVFWLFTHWE